MMSVGGRRRAPVDEHQYDADRRQRDQVERRAGPALGEAERCRSGPDQTAIQMERCGRPRCRVWLLRRRGRQRARDSFGPFVSSAVLGLSGMRRHASLGLAPAPAGARSTKAAKSQDTAHHQAQRCSLQVRGSRQSTREG